ncbi:MAG: hypothetical protein Q8N13_09740 [Acidovorax sp.]|nr:hypothetical protein [Acidovorax sp.]
MQAYRSIDHVMLRLHAAEPLFDLLTNTLALPVAWPLQRTPFANYGWVHVGNTDLELWAAASNADLPEHAQPPLFHGFALEPALPLAETIEHITASGITCKPARAFETTNTSGVQVTNFTNSVLLDLSEPSCCVFLCEWSPVATIYPWKEPVTPAQRRSQLGKELQAVGGGPLGLLGLHAIHVGTPSLKEHLRQWQALSGSTGHPIQLTPEITLTLFPADHLRIESLTFAVRSLEVARSFLNSRQLLGGEMEVVTDTDTDTTAITVSWGGVKLRFTEPAPQGPL